MAEGTPITKEAPPLIVRRLFRIATASALGRAYVQRSSKWLAIAGGIIVLRFIDGRGRHSRRASKKHA